MHEYIVSRDAYPSPLDYKGFPKSVCTSVNDCVCHGIPGDQVLKDGDIMNVDVTTYLPKEHGYHGDTSVTFYVGEPSEEAIHVVETARRCLELGIAEVKHGNRIGDIGAAIQEYAEGKGCSVVRDYVGHGVGREFHMPPQIPHFGRRGKDKRMKAGMVFTIEPMINVGGYQTEVMDDEWTVLTMDRSLSAQFEHTVLVTRDGRRGADHPQERGSQQRRQAMGRRRSAFVTRSLDRQARKNGLTRPTSCFPALPGDLGYRSRRDPRLLPEPPAVGVRALRTAPRHNTHRASDRSPRAFRISGARRRRSAARPSRRRGAPEDAGRGCGTPR